jgi:CDP-glycerol glycerophosphotransferase (TagB/SpsB family)
MPAASRSWVVRLEGHTHAILAVINWVVPKKSRSVVLASATDVDDGVIAALEEMSGRGFACTVLITDSAKQPWVAKFCPPGARLVRKNSLRGVWSTLRAQVVVSTHGLNGSRAHPSRQTVVNLWHGEPGGKRTGRFGGSRRRISCSIAPVASSLGRGLRAASFGVHPASVAVLGAARNDRLLTADPEAARKLLGETDAPGRQFVWLPTFRQASWTLGSGRTVTRSDVDPGTPATVFGAEALKRLDEWLVAQDATLTAKLHPLAQADLNDALDGTARAIRVVTDQDLWRAGTTLYELLSGADLLITDASSVWQDFLLLQRPIAFAFPDLEQYRRSRGFILEPVETWWPGPIAQTMESLLEDLGKFINDPTYFEAERRLALARLHRYRDAASAERLVDEIERQLEHRTRVPTS